MPFTLANTERGTIAIPCPRCNALLETSLDKFVSQNDYRLGVRCPRCQAGFTVRLEPEQESQLTPAAPDAAPAADETVATKQNILSALDKIFPAAPVS